MLLKDFLDTRKKLTRTPVSVKPCSIVSGQGAACRYPNNCSLQASTLQSIWLLDFRISAAPSGLKDDSDGQPIGRAAFDAFLDGRFSARDLETSLYRVAIELALLRARLPQHRVA
ncbi:MAG: hypothetical protein L0229_27820, partial [Blastocatellia bacterium]|nr:hypothetical protein [Blastocatellia bacterium]